MKSGLVRKGEQELLLYFGPWDEQSVVGHKERTSFNIELMRITPPHLYSPDSLRHRIDGVIVEPTLHVQEILRNGIDAGDFLKTDKAGILLQQEPPSYFLTQILIEGNK